MPLRSARAADDRRAPRAGSRARSPRSPSCRRHESRRLDLAGGRPPPQSRAMNRFGRLLCGLAFFRSSGAAFAQDDIPTDRGEEPTGGARIGRAARPDLRGEAAAALRDSRLALLSARPLRRVRRRRLAGRDERSARGRGASAAAPRAAHRPLQPRLRDLQRRLPGLHTVGAARDRALPTEGEALASDVRGRYSQ